MEQLLVTFLEAASTFLRVYLIIKGVSYYLRCVLLLRVYLIIKGVSYYH